MIKVKEEIESFLNNKELTLVKKLNTPTKVQDFLDKTPFNFEKGGETYMSPRRVLEAGRMHCFEGVLLASLCLEYHGYKNSILDLKVKDGFFKRGEDSDHTLCIFEIHGYCGAISKTNHSVLRFRDPIYKNVRELALSYFHEYFLDDGTKTLQSYSKPFDVWKRFGTSWIVEQKNLDKIADALDRSPHFPFVPKRNKKFVRKAGKTEIKGATIKEWHRSR